MRKFVILGLRYCERICKCKLKITDTWQKFKPVTNFFFCLFGWSVSTQITVMAATRLQADLADTKAEILRLRESMSVATPVVHKDLTLVSVVTKCSGSESSVSLEDFFASIESASRIDNWTDIDNFEIAIFKLTDSAKLVYEGCPQLHKPEATWQNFKDTFRQRYKDVRTDQYHYMMLHTARQGKNEDAQKFADRCRALSQMLLRKTNHPVAQKIHQENAEHMLLASCVAGLIDVVGRQVRYLNPQSIQQAVQFALSVQEAEKQERFNSSFYTRFENSVSLQPKSSSQEYSEGESSLHVSAARTVNYTSQRPTVTRSANKLTASGTRNEQTKEALRCYECEGLLHYARECPTRIKREKNYSHPSGRRNRTEHSKRSGSQGEKPPFPAKSENKRQSENSGNGRRA